MHSQLILFRTKLFVLVKKASPELRRKLFFIFLFLFLLHLFVWIGIFIFSSSYSFLFGYAALAYGLGLRHAVDADHIAAIDNTTRKLIQDQKQPVAVGLFFSLGHSTIVILLSFFIAISTVFVSRQLPQFQHIGAIIGTSLSSFFLLLIGLINVVVFMDIYRIWKHVSAGKHFNETHIDAHLHKRGLIARFLHPLLKTITASWQMYFVGFLFGLGFDTASEVGLLSLSAEGAGKHIPLLAILLLPLAFTAGMALVDTLDGILMLGAYGWAQVKPLRKLYYNLNITLISVVIALFIGSIEGLQVISAQTGMKTGIFFLVNKIQFDSLGYFIIILFLGSWLFSGVFYKYKRYEGLYRDKVETRK
jgi:high-affinity nickel-transport protein